MAQTIAELAAGSKNKRPYASIQSEIEKAHNSGNKKKVRNLIRKLPTEVQTGMGING